MSRITRFIPSDTPGIGKGLFIVPFLLILAFLLTAFIAFRPLGTIQQQWGVSKRQDFQALSPQNVQQGWQTVADEQMGFTVIIPEDWHELDLSKLRYFNGRCFAPQPGDNLVKPQVCIDLNPWVRPPSLKGFASNDLEAQQEFFNNLTNYEAGQIKVEGSTEYEVVGQYQFVGLPAIERIETFSLSAEGIEPFYTVSIYITRTNIGLIRIAMNADDIQQFRHYENTLRQIAGSFSLIR